MNPASLYTAAQFGFFAPFAIEMRVMYVSCLLTLLAVFSSLHQATATDLKPCRGAFDLVFVLDK